MAMRMKYRRNPELLAADVETARERQKWPSELRAKWKNPRRKTRMIGKRELLKNGVVDQGRVGAYLSLPENQHRRISAKTLYKASRTRKPQQ
ncbi:MAG: hypothetical protein QG650_410 [Patescibacteria group bacterium]|nr:hypothetical protein [Patescibacteria group bacterium]